MAQLINIATAIYFLKKLNTPFTSTEAYRLHLIDANGKRTHVPIVTPQQKAAWSYFDIMVNNLKKIIALAPGGNSKLARIAASLLLLKEEQIDLENEKLLETMFYETYDRVVNHKITEDGEPVNNAGSGNIAGIGVGPQGEPGIRPKQMNKYKRANAAGERKMSAKSKSLILALGRR